MRSAEGAGTDGDLGLLAKGRSVGGSIWVIWDGSPKVACVCILVYQTHQANTPVNNSSPRNFSLNLREKLEETADSRLPGLRHVQRRP